MNLEDFIKNRKPKRTSRLSMYDKEIKTLIENGFTIPQIHEFLTLQKVEVSLKYLYRYTLKIKKNTSISSLEIEEIPTKEKSQPKQEEDQREEEIDPVFLALNKLQEENKKKGITGNKVKIWEPKESRVRDWGKNNK